MDEFVESFNLLLDVISRDLLIFDNCSNDDHLHAKRDRLFLEFSLPGEAIHLDFFDDLLAECVKVNFKSPRLDLPDNDRLGNRWCFLLLTDLSSLFFEFLLCRNIGLIIFTEKVEFVFFLFLFCNLGLFASFATFSTLSLLSFLLLSCILFLPTWCSSSSSTPAGSDFW